MTIERRANESTPRSVTARAYDRWSTVWNLARFTNRRLYRAAIEELGDQHHRVLDVGCGSGVMSRKVARSGRRVVGVDLSPRMIARAKRCAGPNERFLQGDAEALPVHDDGFDAVVNLISIQHYEDAPRAAREFYRALRPGGRLVLVAFDRRSLFIRMAQRLNPLIAKVAGVEWQTTPREAASYVEAAGFEGIRVEPVGFWIRTFRVVADKPASASPTV